MKSTILKKRNSIIIQYRINGKQYRIFTGIQCRANEWNKKNKSILKRSDNSTSSNQLIKSYRNQIEAYIDDLKRSGQSYNHDLLKGHIKKKLSTQKEEPIEKDLFYAFDLFIKSKINIYASVTINSYKNSLSHLKKYLKGAEVLPFNKLNKVWFENYLHYLKTILKHSPGTRSNQIKNIKSVLNYAHELDLHDFTKYQSIKKEKANPSNIYLSESEIEQLANTPFAKITEEQIIDSFVFICLTGVRFSDYSKISKKNFTQIDGHWFINFQQAKTKKEVSVPVVYKKACTLLLKYEFELPKYTNAYFNRRLKEVFASYKLFSEKITIHKEKTNGSYVKRDLITIHTGRRTFATNLYLKNTPINLIMAATGHETEKAFRTYIKASEIEKSKGLIQYADY
jgi:integrase